MKKLKATAALCGAIAAVGIGAPAFADDDVLALSAAPVVGGIDKLMGDVAGAPPVVDAAAPVLDAEDAKKKEAGLGMFGPLNDIVDDHRGPVAKPENNPAEEKMRKEARENANNPAIGSADANYNAWLAGRDGKTAKDLSDSQYLGLNAFMPGY
ncbi:hypothetical protein ACFTXB_04195 [Streptomyces sp. NPDC057074]|uniref:hypothetical protein n=1 Tax=Streptomyces sp. NPDC057074 TaxID=3346015 RepID=UPI00363FF663